MLSITPARDRTTGVVTLPSGIRLPYTEQGAPDGAPVVLVHGYSDSRRAWEPVLDHLPGDVRAVAVTQRGHGDADRPVSGYRPHDLAADTIAAMDVLGIGRAVVVGHSAGTVTAQRIAAERPERVHALVLVGAAPTFRGNPVLEELWNDVVQLEDPVDQEFVREFQASTAVHPLPPGLLETVVEESCKLPARVWRAALRDLLDVGPAERPITAPTLVVRGEHDEIARQEDLDAVVAAIPQARTAVYGDTGHSPHWEQPKRLAAAIAALA